MQEKYIDEYVRSNKIDILLGLPVQAACDVVGLYEKFQKRRNTSN